LHTILSGVDGRRGEKRKVQLWGGGKEIGTSTFMVEKGGGGGGKDRKVSFRKKGKERAPPQRSLHRGSLGKKGKEKKKGGKGAKCCLWRKKKSGAFLGGAGACEKSCRKSPVWVGEAGRGTRLRGNCAGSCEGGGGKKGGTLCGMKGEKGVKERGCMACFCKKKRKGGTAALVD